LPDAESKVDGGAATLELRDIWMDLDSLVLREVARWELDPGHGGMFLKLTELLQRLGRPLEDAEAVGASVARLERGGYLEAGEPTLGWPYPHWVTRLTPAGLRAVGAWPNPDSVTDGLMTALEELADRLDAHSPDQAQGLRSALPGIGSALRELGVDLASRVLARAAGLG
jgi:hypothetical protein